MSGDLAYLSIAEAARRIEARTLSPVDLTEAMIARAATIDPALGSFVTRTDGLARAQAKAAAADIEAGRYKGPLHGIPVALKEAFDTAGIRTTSAPNCCATMFPRATQRHGSGCATQGRSCWAN